MKLLHKNILANAFASLAIIILGGVITYYFIINKVDKESEEHLMGEKTAGRQADPTDRTKVN